MFSPLLFLINSKKLGEILEFVFRRKKEKKRLQLSRKSLLPAQGHQMTTTSHKKKLQAPITRDFFDSIPLNKAKQQKYFIQSQNFSLSPPSYFERTVVNLEFFSSKIGRKF